MSERIKKIVRSIRHELEWIFPFSSHEEKGGTKKPHLAAPSEPDLEEFCGDDREVYEALSRTMFLTPWLILDSMEEAAQRGDYMTAGGLAIYEGDVEKVKQYFGKYAEIKGRKLKILQIPERAVKKAQEYYRASRNE